MTKRQPEPIPARQVQLWIEKGGHVRKPPRTKTLELIKGKPPLYAVRRHCYAGDCWSY